ncbi:DUF2254 domain-containing protein [Alkalihalophilus marmarensis]|uniref:DUF2254 domain-containing protein n=1 Tax=Alkalihalophilus marmarensis TaxID=521377 RepID=UPI002E1FF008|nr:DUF2254 domain-containing protein [Alkalihalophilus marmarensis]
MHSLLIKLRNQFWFIPAVYSVVSIVLAVISYLADQYVITHSTLLTKLPAFLITDISLAQTLLSTISSSLLTMTTISFSTIMVVLTTYLSQFSPRTMQNFMTDVHTQRILGVFIGGFLFSLLLLLILRANHPTEMFISPTIAVAYAFVCVGFFVYFVHHVGKWIQVSNLIHKITENTIQSIEHYYEDNQTVEQDEPWRDWESEELILHNPHYIFAQANGYVQIIDVKGLTDQSEADNIILKVEAGLGNYIEQGGVLFELYGALPKEKHTLYAKHILLGGERATIQDIDFGLTKLVEITLRALSSGINDPNTAVSGVRALARVLTVLSRKNLHRTYYNDSNGNLRVIFQERSFNDYLYRCFYQIRQYGCEDLSVLNALIESLKVIAINNSEEIKESVWDFAAYIRAGLHPDEILDLDKRYLNDKWQQLAIHTDKSDHFIPL